VDLRWHATHDEFEGASQQLEAHWLLWLGVLVMLVAVVWARARLDAAGLNTGHSVLLVACVSYVALAAWHFVEHASGADPELAHILIAVSDFGIIAGVALLTLLAKRGRGRPATG
jgi:hypothetical protein